MKLNKILKKYDDFILSKNIKAEKKIFALMLPIKITLIGILILIIFIWKIT